MEQACLAAIIWLTRGSFRYPLPFVGRILRIAASTLDGASRSLYQTPQAKFLQLGQAEGVPTIFTEKDGDLYVWPIPDYSCLKLLIVYEGMAISERKQRLRQALNTRKAQLVIELRQAKI